MYNKNTYTNTFYINTSNSYTSSIVYWKPLEEMKTLQKGDVVLHYGEVGVVVKKSFPYALVKFYDYERFCDLTALTLVDNKVEDLL